MLENLMAKENSAIQFRELCTLNYLHTQVRHLIRLQNLTHILDFLESISTKLMDNSEAFVSCFSGVKTFKFISQI